MDPTEGTIVVKELVICSGKGGTGKTSIVAAFAALARQKVMADCDVDAADLHLVMAPEIRQRERFLSGHEAQIVPEACTGCGVCQDLCQYDAITELEPVAMAQAGPVAGVPRYAIDPLRCEGCGVCVHFCPDDAIAFPERDCGEWFLSDTRYGPLVHAKLGVAAENSGKLVTLVRQQARKIATQQRLPLVIVDGPPGIGCPVIATLGGADLLLAVTEPTPAGLHDLERLIELAAHFQVPTEVCINKYDINPDLTEKIAQWCRSKWLPLAGLVPYDQEVTAAQMDGEAVVARNGSPAAAACCWAGLNFSTRKLSQPTSSPFWSV